MKIFRSYIVGVLLVAFLLCSSLVYSKSPNQCPRLNQAGYLEAESLLTTLESQKATNPVIKKVLFFIRQIVLPVLKEGDRIAFARFLFNLITNTLIVISPDGAYEFQFVQSQDLESPSRGKIPIATVNATTQLITADAKIFLDEAKISSSDLRWINRLQGIVRSSFNSDAYLHGQISMNGLEFSDRPDGHSNRTILTLPQIRSINELLDIEAEANSTRTLYSGIMMPTGLGKTIAMAHYLLQLDELKRLRKSEWKKKPKILIVVENEFILRDFIKKLEREFQGTALEISQSLILAGDTTSRPITLSEDVIAVTRSTCVNRIGEILALINPQAGDPVTVHGDSEQPWVVIFDEAHHLGALGEDAEAGTEETETHATREAQFEQILRMLNERLKPIDRVLLASATLWHSDQNLIQNILNGNIVAPFLTPTEMEKLKRGESTERLARLQLVRAISSGYLKALHSFHQIHPNQLKVPENGNYLHIARQNPQTGETEIIIYPAIVDDLKTRITSERIAGIPPRILFFAPTRAHASAYAASLQQALGFEVRPLHGGNDSHGTAIGKNTNLTWYKDQAATPKGLVVVDMLREGVDLPETNMIVVLRRFTRTQGGLRGIMQCVGRGTRLAHRKPYLVVLDYSNSTDLILNAMHAIGLGQISSGGGGGGPRHIKILVDKDRYQESDFRERDPDLYLNPDDYLLVEDVFGDDEILKFVDGGLTALIREARFNNIMPSVSNSALDLFYLLVLRLPADKRLDIMEQIHPIGLKANDLQSAKALSINACIRIMRALRVLASAFTSGSAEISDLYTYEGTTKLLLGLEPKSPERFRVVEIKDVSDSEVDFFVDKANGGYEVFSQELKRYGFQILASGIVGFFNHLAKFIKDEKIRQQFLDEISELFKIDIDPKAKYHLSSNKTDIKKVIHLLKLLSRYIGFQFASDVYKRSDLNSFFQTLDTKCPTYAKIDSDIDDEIVKTFKDKEQGVLATLMAEAKRYGIDLSLVDGFNKLLLLYANKIKDETIKKLLIESINSVDGINSQNFYGISGSKKGAKKIIQILRELAGAVDSSLVPVVHTRNGLGRLIQMIMPAHPGVASELFVDGAKIGEFADGRTGGMPIIDYYFRTWLNKNDGMRKMMLALAERLTVSPELKQSIISLFQEIQWDKTCENVGNGICIAINSRVIFALQVLVSAMKQTYPDRRFNPCLAHTKGQIELLFRELKINCESFLS